MSLGAATASMIGMKDSDLVVLNVSGLFLAAVLFMGGYHSIDLSYNVLLISYAERQSYWDTWVDCSAMGYCASYREWYNMGWVSEVAGVVILFSLDMVNLISATDKRDKAADKLRKHPEHDEGEDRIDHGKHLETGADKDKLEI